MPANPFCFGPDLCPASQRRGETAFPQCRGKPMIPVAIAVYALAIISANLLVLRFGPPITPLLAFFLVGLDLALRNWLNLRMRPLAMGLLILRPCLDLPRQSGRAKYRDRLGGRVHGRGPGRLGDLPLRLRLLDPTQRGRRDRRCGSRLGALSDARVRRPLAGARRRAICREGRRRCSLGLAYPAALVDQKGGRPADNLAPKIYF